MTWIFLRRYNGQLKTLSFEIKEQLIQQILMYFVSPLKEITDVHFSQLTYAGLKCATFELTIDGEDFVFIPGNSEAILGWDLGVQGLPATCWSKIGSHHPMRSFANWKQSMS